MTKPRKIQVYDYYDPNGPPDDVWRHGDRCSSLEGEVALLCDSEEHADRLLDALATLEAENRSEGEASEETDGEA